MIIGVAGTAGSGKDARARVLVAGNDFERRALADALRTGARAMFGLSHGQVHGQDKERVDGRWGLSPRQILQRLGTEAMRREFGDDVWIRDLFGHIDARPEIGNWVVPDVRFPNEARAIKAQGGEVWLIKRPDVVEVGVRGHASEKALDDYRDWDNVVDNDGDLSDLESAVDVIMSKRGK